jgi:multidrug resistance efflux pump
MPSAFSRTTRSLDADRARFTTPILGFCLLLLLMWGSWFTFATVPVYEVTNAARLEVIDAAHPVSAVVGGRVVETRLAIGRVVEQGEVLVELDAGAERLSAAETRVRLADLETRRAGLQAELRAHERALASHAAAQGVASDEARAQAQEAEARARLAASEAERSHQLLAGGVITRAEWERARADADAKRAHADALALSVGRLAGDRGVEASDRRTRIAELHRRITELEGEAAVEAARIERLEYLVDQHRIRAPVAGRVGEVAALEVGHVTQPGDVLGSVVPASDLRVVAYFPAAALGHIRPSQTARVRLSGFSWTEYGRLRAVVTEVGSEARGGQFRAELRLLEPRPPLIPVEHGLPGSAEIEVERVSPFTLVLRAAGRTRNHEQPADARVAATPRP